MYMKRLKKSRILSLFLCMAVIFGMMAGCSDETGQENNGKISIVTTSFSQYDFAREIVGDRANVTLLLKPGMDAHSYEPSPKDIIMIAKCDLFLNVGGESETWLESVLESSENHEIRIVSAMDCVEVLEEETVEGMQSKAHDHDNPDDDEEHDHPQAHGDGEEYDEHVWTSPVNAIKIVNSINEALCQIDPKNADYYCANTDAYAAKLIDLDNAFRDVITGSKRKLIVFGDRFPLLYFIREYGLDYYAAFPGCASETEPSAATVAFLIDTVRRERVPVIFYIELSNHKVADAIAECTGTKAVQFNTCHNISYDDFRAGESYLSLMTANIEVLREALN